MIILAYQKIPVQSGDVISSNWGNHIQTQYEEAKADLDNHANDDVRHITAAERSNWNAKETPAGAQAKADAAEQAAIAWATSENVTVIDTVPFDVPGSQYPGGVTTFSVTTSDGYPVQGVVINFSPDHDYRFAQLLIHSGTSGTDEIRKRTWRPDSGWSDFDAIWDENNLPNPARTDVDNNFTQTQTFSNARTSSATPTGSGNGYFRNTYIHSANPSGGNNGDVYYKY